MRSVASPRQIVYRGNLQTGQREKVTCVGVASSLSTILSLSFPSGCLDRRRQPAVGPFRRLGLRRTSPVTLEAAQPSSTCTVGHIRSFLQWDRAGVVGGCDDRSRLGNGRRGFKLTV
jgi:hypothetical protein